MCRDCLCGSSEEGRGGALNPAGDETLLACSWGASMWGVMSPPDRKRLGWWGSVLPASIPLLSPPWADHICPSFLPPCLAPQDDIKDAAAAALGAYRVDIDMNIPETDKILLKLLKTADGTFPAPEEVSKGLWPVALAPRPASCMYGGLGPGLACACGLACPCTCPCSCLPPLPTHHTPTNCPTNRLTNQPTNRRWPSWTPRRPTPTSSCRRR